MKRFALGICLAAIVAASLAAAAGDQDFLLINKTGLTVDEVYLSPSDDDSWGEDVLGIDVLPDDGRVQITFSRKETACVWDLKIVDEDDDDVVWEEIDLCKASQVTLYYRNGKPTAEIR